MNGIDVLMAQGIEWRIMDRRVQGSNPGCNRAFTQRKFCHSKQNTFWPEPTTLPRTFKVKVRVRVENELKG